MKMKHRNIALFVPHAGCPHQCSFCNQRTISGKAQPLTAAEVHSAAQLALSSGGRGGEIAFFGGSFTAIDREYMLSLLKAAHGYIEDGSFDCIRISTRPDAIDDEILDLLEYYGVANIELGVQSLDDEVLSLNERGHTAATAERAARLIKARGFSLGLQMMTGLLGDDGSQSLQTAKKIISLEPDFVRIYPTVVLEGTRLFELWQEGRYRAQTIEQAVELCSELLLLFHSASIPVIRLGLHSGGSVDEGFAAGAYHPALRELCEGRIYLTRALELLSKEQAGDYCLAVAPSEISKLIGQKKCNLAALRHEGYSCRVLPCEGLKKYEIQIMRNIDVS